MNNIGKRYFDLDQAVLDIAPSALRPCSQMETRAIAEYRLADINTRIRDLESMQTTLSKLIRTCRAGNQPPCPIIASLGRDTD